MLRRSSYTFQSFNHFERQSMSTEFTLERVCEESGERSSLFLGLSTAQTFQFRAHPTLGLISFEAVKEFIVRDGAKIVTEYNEPFTLERFESWIKNRVSDKPLRSNQWKDPQGYLFADYDFS